MTEQQRSVLKRLADGGCLVQSHAFGDVGYFWRSTGASEHSGRCDGLKARGLIELSRRDWRESEYRITDAGLAAAHARPTPSEGDDGG